MADWRIGGDFALIKTRRKISTDVARSMLDWTIIMDPFYRSARAICAIGIIPVSILSALGAGGGAADNVGKAARLNSGAKVEFTMPESARQNGQTSVVITSDDSIRCPLSEGDTTFVVRLPNSGALEGLKFVNENVAARGTLKIAVSNEALAPNSARWTAVDGDVSFQHKRLFNVSVVGVEAKFVRVTFSVERDVPDFTLTLKDLRPAKRDFSGVYLNEVVTRQTIFGDNCATANTTLLLAGLNP